MFTFYHRVGRLFGGAFRSRSPLIKARVDFLLNSNHSIIRTPHTGAQNCNQCGRFCIFSLNVLYNSNCA